MQFWIMIWSSEYIDIFVTVVPSIEKPDRYTNRAQQGGMLCLGEGRVSLNYDSAFLCDVIALRDILKLVIVRNYTDFAINSAWDTFSRKDYASQPTQAENNHVFTSHMLLEGL